LSVYQAPEVYVRQFVERVLSGVDDVWFYEEMRVPYVKLRADYGVEHSIILEAEPPCEKDRGRDQLKRNMERFGRDYGVLVDVPTERYYVEYPRPCRGRVGFELYMRFGDRYDAVYVREFDVRGGMEAEVISRAVEELRNLIVLLKKVSPAREKPTPEGLIVRVNELIRRHLQKLKNMFSSAPDRVKLYFNTWKNSMELVYGKEVIEGVGDLEELFARLTIYVTWLKCLGVTLLEAVLGGGKYTLPTRLYTDGYRAAVDLFWHRSALAKFNINYLFERDEYDWVFDPDIASQLNDFFKDIGAFLLSVDWSQEASLDLLKRIYQNVVPREVRRQLGEFYTPDWIAQIIIWRALHMLVRGSPPSRLIVEHTSEDMVELIEEFYRRNGRIPRFIDPTCGSFTFGVHYINSLLKWYAEKKPPVNPVDFAVQIMESVVGIDLNPVAVTTARVNYLLQIHRLLAIHGGYLVIQPIIPILRVDLLSIHMSSGKRGRVLYSFEEVSRGGEKMVFRIPLEFLGIKVSEDYLEGLRSLGVDVLEHRLSESKTIHYLELYIPLSIVKKVKGLVLLARAFTALLDAGVEGFENEIGSKLDREEVDALNSLRNTFLVLEGKGLDRIWHSIILNHLLARYIVRERFELVLGNLPWVNVSKYPEGYAELIKVSARELSVSPPPQAARKLDISIPLFAISLRYLAGSPSVTALMVPCSVFRGLHGAAWRKFVSSHPHRLVEVWDLEDVKPFEGAENQPGIAFVFKG